ncbi:MAG: ABC transporter permease [bacterium]
MLIWVIVKLALKSLWANKLRSFLAMLGIIIGVGAVISMLALGAGARNQVMERIAAMGTDILIVRPGQRGSHRGVVSGTQQNLTIEDARSILENVPFVRQVAPVVRGGAQIKYFNRNTPGSIIGTSPTYLDIRNFTVEKGRGFTERETEGMARVAVLGTVTARNLFGVSDPVGETIKIKGINFRVIGVLESKGDQGWFNPDDQVLVPYSTAMQRLFGLDHLHEIDIQATARDALEEVQEGTTTLLRLRHDIPPEDPDDFRIHNQAEMLRTATDFTRTFTILLGSIASISLLVGGIGIMNIMLVTVTERTREIGIRKAIGAKDRDIVKQFLIEAVLITLFGGVFGVFLGVGGAFVVERLLDFPTLLQVQGILLALLFSAAVGIFFGFYPARRAALLDPIQALRYE